VTFIEGATLAQVVPLPEPAPEPRPESDRDAGGSIPPKVHPPLTPVVELKMLQQRYPEGLWCTSPEPCEHRLLATTAAGWSKSWLAGFHQTQRLALRDRYICAECKYEAAEKERVAEGRRERAATARAIAVRNRREAADVGLQGVGLDGHSRTRINTGRNGVGFYHPTVDSASAEGLPKGSRRVGGRPRKHADLKAARRAAQAAYRDRKKTVRVHQNDELANEAAA
jgi:hypothetical protein